MKLLFDSECKNFLNMYEPEITTVTDIEICADDFAVDYFLKEIKELNPTKSDLNEKELKQNYGFKMNKNHVTIPSGVSITILDMGKPFEPLMASIKGLRFTMYITFEADAAVVEAIPLNKEFEKVFANKYIPNEKDNITLYGINIVDLVDAVSYEYPDMEKNIAYEYLKMLTEQQVISYYNKWKKYNENLEAELKEYAESLKKK